MKRIPVNIQHLEQAFNVDLQEFLPGETYPLSNLFETLKLQRHLQVESQEEVK